MFVTVINIALVFVNLYSIGVSESKLQIVQEKLDDLSMLEERIKHIAENLDSCPYRQD